MSIFHTRYYYSHLLTVSGFDQLRCCLNNSKKINCHKSEDFWIKHLIGQHGVTHPNPTFISHGGPEDFISAIAFKTCAAKISSRRQAK